MKNKKSSPALGTKKLYFRVMAMIFIAFLITACTSEFDLELEKNEPKLVVDGWITSLPGPYVVRLTKSSPAIGNLENYYAYAKTEPVKDAIVIISDNSGTVDTLQPKLPKVVYIYEGDTIIYESDTIIYEIDTIYEDNFIIDDGFYETTKIEGVPGRTYTLYVKVQGKEYTANAYMPPVPPIESVGYNYKKDSFGKNETYLVPTITFNEPQGTNNYFMLILGDITGQFNPAMRGTNRLWEVAVLSDELLPPHVKDFPVDDGVSPSGMEWYRIYNGEEFDVNMFSLTEEAYDYFRASIAQFSNDGGAYQPAPASPPTNISNGGLGFFGASAVSNKKGYVE